MSTDQEKQNQETLQHDAEHERPPLRRNPVLVYLVILFAAAFLLLLMSYFSQQRANQAAMDDLQQSSSSAVDSLENLIAERDSLKEQLDGLEQEIAQLQEERDAALQTAQESQANHEAAISAAVEQNRALIRLNEIRALYNQRRYSQARALLSQWEAGEPGALEQQLAEISAALSDEEREIYDPLEAYHNLVDWLS